VVALAKVNTRFAPTSNFDCPPMLGPPKGGTTSIFSAIHLRPAEGTGTAKTVISFFSHKRRPLWNWLLENGA
jgi:hypothetical protein